jgi:hypothetical protein
VGDPIVEYTFMIVCACPIDARRRLRGQSVDPFEAWNQAIIRKQQYMKRTNRNGGRFGWGSPPVMDPRAAKLLLDGIILIVQYQLEYIMMPTVSHKSNVVVLGGKRQYMLETAGMCRFRRCKILHSLI